MAIEVRKRIARSYAFRYCSSVSFLLFFSEFLKLQPSCAWASQFCLSASVSWQSATATAVSGLLVNPFSVSFAGWCSSVPRAVPVPDDLHYQWTLPLPQTPKPHRCRRSALACSSAHCRLTPLPLPLVSIVCLFLLLALRFLSSSPSVFAGAHEN